MSRPVNLVVVIIALHVQQAVIEQGCKVKVHLLRAEICPGHNVCLFDSYRGRGQNIMNDVKFASVP